jgi:hypothetical protein
VVRGAPFGRPGAKTGQVKHKQHEARGEILVCGRHVLFRISLSFLRDTECFHHYYAKFSRGIGICRSRDKGFHQYEVDRSAKR